MIRILSSSIVVSLLAWPVWGESRPAAARTQTVLRLEQVIERAISRATAEDARQEVTKSNLQLLQALGKTRIELRPSLGLLSFTNPFLLATNLGSGLLFNNRTAPTPAVLESAKFDVLASELQAQATRVRAQVEAARAYFDLLEKQEVTDLAHKALALRQKRGGEIDEMVRNARLTTYDQVAFEQQVTDLEFQLVEAEAQRRGAATRLGLLIGLAETASDIRIEDVNLYSGRWQQPAPPVQQLLAGAGERRGELQLIRSKIDSLRAQGGGPSARKVAVESFGAGYSHVSQARGANLGGMLLGGGRGDLTLRIPLRDTGEKSAQEALRMARIRLLETEMRNVEESITSEVITLETEAAAALERVRLANRKLDLARKAQQAVEARYQAGLTDAAAVANAESAVLAAEWTQARTVNARKASLFMLYAVSGVDGGAPAEGRPGELSVSAQTQTQTQTQKGLP